jgi:hypothetical protein
MQVQTKFLWLFREAAINDHIDGCRPCWIGGWDKCRVLFVVMVERPKPSPPDAMGPALPKRKIDRGEPPSPSSHSVGAALFIDPTECKTGGQLVRTEPQDSKRTGDHGIDFALVLNVLRAELLHHEALFYFPFHAETVERDHHAY